ncbi:MAG: ABC transporter ATP-binding protein [Deferribacterales bacterium]
MENEYLRADGITKSFSSRTVLSNVSFTAKRGEFISLLGPSGCGKTTLLRIISGLETSDSGKIFFNGNDYTSVPASKRNFGIVFQSYALFPNMTVTENITYGLKSREKNRTAKQKIADEMLNITGLYAEKEKYPFQLSGGQQQRVALARALALKPSILLLDEPLSALDAKVREKLRREIRSIHDKMNITTVMVTHDQEEAITVSDRIAVMNGGIIEQMGTPDELYFRPKTKFIAGFIGMMNFMEINGEKKGIRPEQIKISPSFSAVGENAVITDMEFRGAFIRLFLNLENRKTETALVVDVSSFDTDMSRLKLNSLVKVQIPESAINF